MGFWNLWHCHGGICPVLKTAEMTQPVGVGQDGKLWTEPTGGLDISPDAKTADMTQPVGLDSDGKLWAEPNVTPVNKTVAMTLPVGVDSDGHLFAEPPAGTDAKVVKVVPTVSSSSIFFSVPAGYKIMTVDLVFVNGGTYKTLALTRIDDNVELQNINFIDKLSGTTATLAEVVSTGGCVLDDDFSLTSYTGVYGVAVCVPN